jgi:hypothetical protein
MYLTAIGAVLYIIGFYLYIDDITTYTKVVGDTPDKWKAITRHREAIRADALKGAIWPILALIWFVKALIWLTNDSLHYPLLLFGLHYKSTKVAEWIDSTFR